MPGNKWTERENQLLKDQYGKLPSEKLAKRLHRTRSAIYQRARNLGLHEGRDKQQLEQRKRRIKEFWKLGWSDYEIAAAIGMDRRHLTETRNRMGLVANGRNERYRKKVADKTREQLERSGLKSLGELRGKRFREVSEKFGWPGVSMRAAQIADALYRIGPMTRRQICDAIGVPWKGTRKSLGNSRVPGQSYMAELQRAGIVVRLPSAVPGKGKGTNQDVYMIALEVEPCRRTER